MYVMSTNNKKSDVFCTGVKFILLDRRVLEQRHEIIHPGESPYEFEIQRKEVLSETLQSSFEE